MCHVIEREGREWACESIKQLQRLAGKGDDWQQLINYLERGTKNRPPAFIRGVQGVIDEIRLAVGRAA